MSAGGRSLWMAMPDIDSDVVNQEAVRLGIVSQTEISGRLRTIAPRLETLTGHDSDRLRAAVYARLGIEPDEAALDAADQARVDGLARKARQTQEHLPRRWKRRRTIVERPGGWRASSQTRR